MTYSKQEIQKGHRCNKSVQHIVYEPLLLCFDILLLHIQYVHYELSLKKAEQCHSMFQVEYYESETQPADKSCKVGGLHHCPKYSHAVEMLKDRGTGCWLARRLPHAGQVSRELGYRVEERGGKSRGNRPAEKWINFRNKQSIRGGSFCLCSWPYICFLGGSGGGVDAWGHCRSPVSSYIVPVTETWWKHWV